MTGNVVVYGHEDNESVGLEHLVYSSEVKETTLFKLKQTNLGAQQLGHPPEGPYFLLGNQLHQAWRLYPDTLDSFVTTIISSQDDPLR